MSAAPAAAPLDAPAGTHPAGRIASLDILRGLALLGMILVHFHQALRDEALGTSWLDAAEGWGTWILVEQKAWGVFAMLFGAGFAVMIRRLEERGAPVVRVMSRRFLALALMGAALEVATGFHVLFTYAVMGFYLLPLRRRSTAVLLLVAALGASFNSLYMLGQRGYAATLPAEAAAARQAAEADAGAVAQARRERLEAAERGPSYGALLRARWETFLAGRQRLRAYLPDINLALILVGFLALRLGIVDDPRGHRRPLLGAMAYGFLAWAIGWGVLSWAVPDSVPAPLQPWMVSSGFGIVQDQWLCLTYAGAVLLFLAYRPAWRQRLALVGTAGRMALTLYVLQAVVIDVLRSGYGFGLRIRPALVPVGTLLLFGALAVLATWWLGRFRFGPLEWLWRGATYGSLPPLPRRLATE